MSVFLFVNQLEILKDMLFLFFFLFLPDDFEIMENEHWKHRAYVGENYEKCINTQTVDWPWIKE